MEPEIDSKSSQEYSDLNIPTPIELQIDSKSSQEYPSYLSYIISGGGHPPKYFFNII